MSDEIYRRQASKNGLDWVHVSVGENTIDRAYRLLAGIPGAADKAIKAAMNRAATAGETIAAKEISHEYMISPANFKKYTVSRRHIVNESGRVTVQIEYRGYHIPLIRFDTKFTKTGGVSAHVKRTNPAHTLAHAFVATMPNGHTGVYERTEKTDKYEGRLRQPIIQVFGPSVPQMMKTNEDVKKKIDERIGEMFDKRLDHEVTRILNGWGMK